MRRRPAPQRRKPRAAPPRRRLWTRRRSARPQRRRSSARLRRRRSGASPMAPPLRVPAPRASEAPAPRRPQRSRRRRRRPRCRGSWPPKRRPAKVPSGRARRGPPPMASTRPTPFPRRPPRRTRRRSPSSRKRKRRRRRRRKKLQAVTRPTATQRRARKRRIAPRRRIAPKRRPTRTALPGTRRPPMHPKATPPRGHSQCVAGARAPSAAWRPARIASAAARLRARLRAIGVDSEASSSRRRMFGAVGLVKSKASDIALASFRAVVPPEPRATPFNGIARF
mmetsp:Transcript_57515/g.159151  ORF Transcript_57515/g.159151 Transcript_57515/m.159151 type:complete len:281 (-) Transcript_57515:52-894(-)